MPYRTNKQTKHWCTSGSSYWKSKIKSKHWKQQEKIAYYIEEKMIWSTPDFQWKPRSPEENGKTSLKCWKRKKPCQSGIPYSGDIQFSYESKITFLDKTKKTCTQQTCATRNNKGSSKLFIYCIVLEIYYYWRHYIWALDSHSLPTL